MRSGHIVKSCKSLHRCQKPHHTLLHLEDKSAASVTSPADLVSDPFVSTAPIASSHAAAKIKSDLLLMTSRVQVESPDGSRVESARALLDCGSSASFISERLAQNLRLPRSSHSTRISGVAGFVCDSTQPVTTFQVDSRQFPARKLVASAVIIPRVTCDLPPPLI